MNIKLLVAVISALFVCATLGSCKECNDRGFKYMEIDCPLCEGHGTVSPAYYGNAAGVTRWTVTESFYGGVKIGEWESDKKYKRYTFTKCPLCNYSKHPGKITMAEQCGCGKDLTKLNVQNFETFKRLVSKKMMEYFANEHDLPKKDDFFWTRLSVEKKCWKIDSKNKDAILMQAITQKYLTESASFAREKQSDR